MILKVKCRHIDSFKVVMTISFIVSNLSCKYMEIATIILVISKLHLAWLRHWNYFTVCGFKFLLERFVGRQVSLLNDRHVKNFCPFVILSTSSSRGDKNDSIKSNITLVHAHSSNQLINLLKNQSTSLYWLIRPILEKFAKHACG